MRKQYVFGWARITFYRKMEEGLRLAEWLIAWTPQKNPEVPYFSSFLASNLFLLLSPPPPFNLCIILPLSWLPSVFSCHTLSLCLFASPPVLQNLLKHQIPVLSFDGVLLSACLSVSLPVFVALLRHSHYTVLTMSVRDVSPATHAWKHTINWGSVC